MNTINFFRNSLWNFQKSLTFTFFTLIACCEVTSDAATEHSKCSATVPSLTASYTIKDLGATSLKQEQLTHLEPLYSLAPMLNNQGLVIYNTAEGAYVRNLYGGGYALSIPGIMVFAHALNHKGDVLVSLIRKDQEIEWMVWRLDKSCKNGTPTSKRHIAHLDRNQRAFFCSLNDNAMVTGYREIEEKLCPLIWTPCTGLQPLGICDRYHIRGFPRGINNCGTVVGFFQEANDALPFTWNCCSGLEIERNYRNHIKGRGWIELADILIDQTGVVYGTYFVKYQSVGNGMKDLNRYFMYRWNGKTDCFRPLDVQDMRLSSINASNTIVGSSHGRAAILFAGQQPIDANTLISNPNGEWELLEATNINDKGEIVGYGQYKKEMHIFLLEPAL